MSSVSSDSKLKSRSLSKLNLRPKDSTYSDHILNVLTRNNLQIYNVDEVDPIDTESRALRGFI
jgi:hypothetical protein